MLGSEFLKMGRRLGYEMIGWTRLDLELEKPTEGILRLKESRPDVVIHCAAETNVDLCENDRDRILRVNAETSGLLAEAAQELGAHFVFISTSGLVVGNKESAYHEGDLPNPLTRYGASKFEGEKRVCNAHAGALILRAGWLFGGLLEMKKNFVGARLREAEGKKVIYSAIDKKGSPTWTQDFVEDAFDLLRRETKGIVHLANSGEATRFEYVREIMRLTGQNTIVEGVYSERFQRSAPVPKNEALTSIRINEAKGNLKRTWQHALEEYLKLRNKQETEC